MTIKVTVNSDGSYSFDPKIKVKDKGKGTITWELKTNGYHFVSPGVTWGTPVPSDAPAPGTVFSNLDVKATKITVDDDNQNSSSGNYDYPYTLSIAADTPNPSARAEQSRTMEAAAVMVASDPIIRNGPGS